MIIFNLFDVNLYMQTPHEICIFQMWS